MKDFFSAIRSSLREQIPLNRYVTFRTGGPADYFFEPDSLETLKAGLQLFSEKKIPMCVLGDGSNTLVHDDGFRGAVIHLQSKAFSSLEKVEPLSIRAGSGVKNHALAAFAATQGIEGFEFLCGFPGTLGGSAFGNAGSKEETLGMCLREITCVSPDGESQTFLKSQFDYRYRTFPLLQNKIIVSLLLEGAAKNTPEKIQEKIEEVRQTRRKKDPKGFTCGSVFKNPEGVFAWQVIEQLGLRGYRVGGARFSETHPNWILCDKDAKSMHVWALICLARSEAQGRLGILLETEVRLLGDFLFNS